MSLPRPANDTVLQQRLAALEIDLQSVLLLSEALLRGVTAASCQMHHAIDVALGEALRTTAADDWSGSPAVHAIVSQARAKLQAEASLQDRMALDIEDLIIDAASAIPGDDSVVIEHNFAPRRPKRPYDSPA